MSPELWPKRTKPSDTEYENERPTKADAYRNGCDV